MRTFAEFQTMGRVGKVKEVGTTLRVSIAAEYGRKDNDGEFQTNPYWNEVTIFNENVIKWAKDNVAPGDLVHARGTIRQTASCRFQAVLHQSPDKRGVPLPVKMVSQLTQTWHSQVRSFC